MEGIDRWVATTAFGKLASQRDANGNEAMATQSRSIFGPFRRYGTLPRRIAAP